MRLLDAQGRAMDARQAMYHIANRKQWEARFNEIDALLDTPLSDVEVRLLLAEQAEIREKLDGYYDA